MSFLISYAIRDKAHDYLGDGRIPHAKFCRDPLENVIGFREQRTDRFSFICTTGRLRYKARWMKLQNLKETRQLSTKNVIHFLSYNAHQKNWTRPIKQFYVGWTGQVNI